jgi:hypothetical protein
MKKLIIITLLFSTSCLMAEPAPGRAALLKNTVLLRLDGAFLT